MAYRYSRRRCPFGETLRSSLVSWGDDNYGQVTDTPKDSNFTTISANRWHTIALKEDGTIVSWGNDESIKYQILQRVIVYYFT